MKLSAAIQPAPSPPCSSERLAKSPKLGIAYELLEPKVCDLTHAAAVFEMVMDSNLGNSHGVEGVHTFQMTTHEWNTLFYAMYQVTNLANDLKRQYYDGFDQPTPTH